MLKLNKISAARQKLFIGMYCISFNELLLAGPKQNIIPAADQKKYVELIIQ